MEVLVFSPTPTFPADQGNRQRVRALCTALQLRGARIHFAYFPREWGGRFSAEGHREMTRQWDYFDTVIPSKPFVHLAEGRQFGIDDWWDEAIGRFVRYKTASHRFDACIVNYAFFSRVFTHLPPGVTRILDTHDRLSGRREMLERHGVAPEFFYTEAAQEKIALDRADLVIAINAEEARFFRSLSATPVVTLGHVAEGPPPFAARPAAAARKGVLRMGFLGSSNSVNVKNVSDFLARLAREPALPGMEIHLYGACCNRIVLPAACPTPIRRFGPVADLSAFYGAVDGVFVPFLFGTGQKIKLIEALSCGLPLIATANASEGSGSTAPAHCLGSFDEVIAAMRLFASEPEYRAALAADTARVFAAYRRQGETALDTICALVTPLTPGIAIEAETLAAACRGWPAARILDTGCRLIAVLDMLSTHHPLLGKAQALEAIRRGLAMAAGKPPPPPVATEPEGRAPVPVEILGLTRPDPAPRAAEGRRPRLRVHLPGLAPAVPPPGDARSFDLFVDLLPPGGRGGQAAELALRTPCVAHPPQPALRCTRVLVLAADLESPAVTGCLPEIAAGLRLRLGRAVPMLGIDAEGRQALWQGTGFAPGTAAGGDVVEVLTSARAAVLGEPAAVLAIGFSQESAGAFHRLLVNDAGPLVSLPGTQALAVAGEALARSPAEAMLWLAEALTAPGEAAARSTRRRVGVAALESAPLASARLRRWIEERQAEERGTRIAAAMALEPGGAPAGTGPARLEATA